MENKTYADLNAAAPTGMRYCTHFKEFRPQEDFARLPRGPNGLNWYCREANAAKAGASIRKHWARKDIIDAVKRTRLRNAEGKADWRPVDLTSEYLESINIGVCHCCGAIPQARVPAQRVTAIGEDGEPVEVWRPEMSVHVPLKLELDCVRPDLRQYCPGNVGYLCQTCNGTKSNHSLTWLLDRFDRLRINAGTLIVSPSPAMRLWMLALYVADPEGRREHYRAIYEGRTNEGQSHAE
ncbi:hypothetical protein [Cupriavidus alkaliphilus]|uniref:hypothetical protein n=1 Tax=Cupriavidus alkaliphilus TaxID=942866 RepID=UPI00339D6621